MARYTCSLTVAIPLEQLQSAFIEILKSCNFRDIYTTTDFIMASEKPGDVNYRKLVTAEVFIHRSTATESEVNVSVEVKNEELALHLDNHCFQMFNVVQEAIYADNSLQLIKLVDRNYHSF